MASKILLVDDEDDLREIISFFITDELDEEVIEASSGNQAIELLDQHNDIVVIVSDNKMKNGTGIDLYKYNSEHKNIPFIMISGGVSDDYPELNNFLETNRKNNFCSKPFKNQDIIAAIKSAKS